MVSCFREFGLPTLGSHLLIILRILLFKSLIYVWLFVTPLIAAHISLLHYTSLYPGVWYPPCPLLSPGVCSNSCPLSWWCNPTISSSVIPFSSHLQSFPASGSFPMSQLFESLGQSIGVSASTSFLTIMTIQDWFPLGWTGWNSLQSKGLSRVFSNTTQFKSVNSLCIQWNITQPQKWNKVILSYTDGPRDGHTKQCQKAKCHMIPFIRGI